MSIAAPLCMCSCRVKNVTFTVDWMRNYRLLLSSVKFKRAVVAATANSSEKCHYLERNLVLAFLYHVFCV